MPHATRNTLIVFLLWFAGLGAAAQFAKIAIPFAYFQEIYPDQGAQLGWLLSLVSFIGAFLGIIAGGLVGRFGAKPLLLAGLALGAFLSFWQASFPAFPILLTSRIVEGLSHLAIVVAAPTLIAQLSSDRYRGAAMALWSTFFGVSFALVAWLGMPMVETNGPGWLLMVHGAVMLAIAGLSALFVPRILNKDPSESPDQADSLWSQHRRAYGSPTISAPGIGWLFYTLTFVSLIALFPQKLPADLGTRIAGLMPLASIAVSLVFVPLLLRFTSSVAITNLGFCGAIAVVAAALLGAPLATIAVGLFAVLGLVQGASFSAVPELNQTIESRALGYGVMAQMGNVGNLIGTPLLLAVLGFAGDGAMFALVIILYGLGIAAHILQSIRRSRET